MQNKKRNSIDSFSPHGNYKGKVRDGFAANRPSRPIQKSPLTEEQRRKLARARAAQIRKVQEKSSTQKDVNISIKLSMPSSLPVLYKRTKKKILAIKPPSLGELKGRLRNLGSAKYAVGGLVVLILIVGAGYALYSNKSVNEQEQSGGQSVQGAQNSAKPEFEVVVPKNNKDVQQRYDAERRVLSYAEKIGDTYVTISQQQMPEAFKLDPQGSVKTMAERFNANESIEAGETTAFAGKSAQGPQSIIFQKKNALIFIYSPVELEREKLVSFIKSLE